MNDALYIDVIGTDALLKRFNDTEKNVKKAAMLAGQQVGMKIIAEAKRNLRLNNSIVTGMLRNSGKLQKANDGLDIGFFDSSSRSSGYASRVEFGGRLSKIPKGFASILAAWAKKKFQLPDRDAKRMGYFVSEKIRREGSEPHPYFYPAVDKELPKFETVIQKFLDHYKEFGKWQ